MRPQYEDELTRRREETLARLIADNYAAYGLMEHPMLMRCPRMYDADWMLVNTDNVVEALLECKVRERSYPSYMVSLHKAASITHMAAYAGARALLGVYWEDKHEVGVIDLMRCDRVCRPGGRVDRGDWQDREPTIHINMTDFKIIKADRIV